MLRFLSSLIDTPVQSLRTGETVASVITPIVSPETLNIIGLFCETTINNEVLVLYFDDIRELGPLGIIIDDVEQLVEPSDIIRIQKIVDSGFEILSAKVQTETGRSVGKVDDVTFDDTVFAVNKLYVLAPWWRDLARTQRILDRKQILDIQGNTIIVREPFAELPKSSLAATSPTTN